MAGRELEGTLNLAVLQKGVSMIFDSRDLMQAFPARALVEGFTTRLKAEQTLDVKMTVGFRFPDVNESFGLEVRRGVAQFHPQMPEPTDAVITLNKSTLNRILLGQTKFADAVTTGDIRVTTKNLADVQRF